MVILGARAFCFFLCASGRGRGEDEITFKQQGRALTFSIVFCSKLRILEGSQRDEDYWFHFFGKKYAEGSQRNEDYWFYFLGKNIYLNLIPDDPRTLRGWSMGRPKTADVQGNIV